MRTPALNEALRFSLACGRLAVTVDVTQPPNKVTEEAIGFRVLLRLRHYPSCRAKIHTTPFAHCVNAIGAITKCFTRHFPPFSIEKWR